MQGGHATLMPSISRAPELPPGRGREDTPCVESRRAAPREKKLLMV